LLNEYIVEHKDNAVSPSSLYVTGVLHFFIMQEPTEEASASVPTENVREDPNLNRTVAVRRKAAKRNRPWDLAVEELELMSPPPPQAEDIPATKKQRLEEPISASADEAAAKISSLDTAVGLPTDEHADAVSVKLTRATGH
jgi:hypothetical protein